MVKLSSKANAQEPEWDGDDLKKSHGDYLTYNSAFRRVVGGNARASAPAGPATSLQRAHTAASLPPATPIPPAIANSIPQTPSVEEILRELGYRSTPAFEVTLLACPADQCTSRSKTKQISRGLHQLKFIQKGLQIWSLEGPVRRVFRTILFVTVKAHTVIHTSNPTFPILWEVKFLEEILTFASKKAQLIDRLVLAHLAVKFEA